MFQHIVIDLWLSVPTSIDLPVGGSIVSHHGQRPALAGCRGVSPPSAVRGCRWLGRRYQMPRLSVSAAAGPWRPWLGTPAAAAGTRPDRVRRERGFPRPGAAARRRRKPSSVHGPRLQLGAAAGNGPSGKARMLQRWPGGESSGLTVLTDPCRRACDHSCSRLSR